MDQPRADSVHDAPLTAATAHARASGDDRYRLAFVTSPDAMTITALEDGRYLDVNEGFTRMFGWTREEVIGRTSSDLAIWPRAGDRDRLLGLIRSQGGCAGVEIALAAKDGRPVTALVSARTLDIGGRACMLAVTHDFGDYVATRARQRRQASFYAGLSACNAAVARCTTPGELFETVCRLAVESAGLALAAIGLVDDTGAVRMASAFGEGQAYARTLDVTVDPGDPRGRGPIGTAIREDRATWCEDFQNDPRTAHWRERGRAFGFRSSAALPIRRGGSAVGVLSLYALETNAFDDEARRLLVDLAASLSFALDNFEREAARQRAERALAASEERYRLLFATSHDAMLFARPDGRVLTANPAACRLFRRSEEEIVRLGRPGLTPAGDPRVAEALAIRQETGQFSGVIPMVRGDGTLFEAELSTVMFTDSTGELCTSVIVRDVTEKRRIAEELAAHRNDLETLVRQRTEQLAEAQAKAEAANAAKTAFVANMSHEIRTPMNAILGFAHLLKRTPLAPDQRDKLDKLRAAGRHLLTIINDILDLSKIESGKMVLESMDFRLESVLAEVRSLIAEEAQVKGLALTMACSGLPPWLRGDPTRLRQALVNYVSNAVKFTPRGSVALTASPVEDRDGRVLVRFEVRDTGIGIPADKRQNLFRAFEQADVSTTRRYGGTGLGLAIAQRLAMLMGGEAGVESEAGVGSTFWLTAWFEKGAPAEHDEIGELESLEAEIRRRHAGTRILLAEDDPTNQEVALALLEGTGLAVDVAHDGRDALRRAMAGYALILMDVRMPGMDGLEAARAVRALPGGRDLPIIAMTASAFDEDRRTCIEAGMDDFVSKPVSPPELFATLIRWLDRQERPPQPAQDR